MYELWLFVSQNKAPCWVQLFNRTSSHNELELQFKHQLQLFVSSPVLLACTIWEYGGVTMQTTMARATHCQHGEQGHC